MTFLGGGNQRASLTRSSAHGALWALLQNVNGRAINFLSQIILARILRPEDFGLIGLAYTLTNVVGALTGFGLDDVLLARPKTLHLWSTPAFGIGLALSSAAALLMVAFAPVAALIYRSPLLIGLITILAAGVVISSVAMVPEMILRRRMRFRLLAGYGFANVVTTQALTILFALGGFGAYAFVLPIPIVGMMRSIVLYSCVPVRLRGMARLSRWRPLLSRGMLLFGQRLLNTARDQGDYFILGITASPTVVGTYMLAFRLAAQPVYALANSLNVVLLPALGTLGGDRERQTEAALRAIRLMSFTVVPFCFLQASVAAPVIETLFGPQWSGAIPLTQILGSGLAFDIIPCVACTLAMARGRFRFQFLASAISFPFFVVAIAVGAHVASALGVAVAVVCYFILSSIGYSHFALAPLQRPITVLCQLWAAPAIMSLPAAGVSVAIGRADTFVKHPLLGAGTSILCGSLVYVALLYLLLPDTMRHMKREFDRYYTASA